MVSEKLENKVRTKLVVEVDLAVCILFYEKLDQTIECIKSFLPSGVNIYILNNGSSSSSRRELEKFCNNYKQVKIFDSDVNLGVGVGRNYLVTHTTEEWLLFIDNDIIVKTPDWLQKFSKYVYQYPEIEVFIPKLFNTHENGYVSYRSIRIVGDKAIHEEKIVNDLTNTFPGGASFIHRNLFDRLDIYDDKMFVGFEDFEFCIRAIRLATPVKARLIHDIELIHNHRQLKNNEDKNASLVRYDVNLLKTSFNRIAEKHNIVLESDWKNWITNQLKKILENEDIAFKKDWKWHTLNQVNRILRKIRPVTHRSIPHSCSLFMTDKCNFKCSGCSRSVIGIKHFKEMTLTTVKKLLSLYPSIDAFCVAGLGEPTLCSNFVDIVNFLRKNEKFVGIITNGTNSNRLLALAYEPNYISISLYGYDNESYLANTGMSAYDTVIETFSKLKLRFKNVGFSYVLNKTKYRDLDKILSLCDDLKPEFLHLVNYLVYDPTITEEVRKIITVKDTEIIDYIDSICVGRDYIRLKPVYVDFNNLKFNCKSYDYIINLDGDGNIGGCQRQIPPDASFGNVFRDKDPYNSLEMCRLRNLMHSSNHIHEECRFCFGNWK